MTEEKYLNETKKLINFIEESPSCFHVVENIKDELTNAGFTEIKEHENKKIEYGGKYFVTRNNSSIIAFRIPKNDFRGFFICAAHSDSPSFKIKPDFEWDTSDLYKKINCEKYGGMIYSTWLDRPLSAAGRVIVETEDGIESRLVNVNKDLCLIPNLAIHMNRDINSGYVYKPQTDLVPLLGESGDNSLRDIIADTVNVNRENIIDFDLFLYNRTPGSIWGLKNEFFSIGKIDDLQCVYAAKEAFLNSENNGNINMLAVFDNEEVGSGTKQGALSTFLSDTLLRIADSLNISNSELTQKISSSFMLSADNGHGVHPNHPEFSDQLSRPKPNGGVLIKYNANQQYSTDAMSGAIFKKMLKNADIPYQVFVNRSDIPGGSTLGNLSNRKISLNTVDIGAAMLSMHSSYETAGTKDTSYLTDAMKIFYTSEISFKGDGNIAVK